MDLLIGILTFILVVTCLFLILVILVQLPKKEAGAGVAFGGAASEALFGAGTGTVLTKVTRYTTTFFLCLAMVLSILQSHRAKAKREAVLRELENLPAAQATSAPGPLTLPEQAPALTPTNNPAGTNAATNAAVPATVSTGALDLVTQTTTTNAPAPQPSVGSTNPPAPEAPAPPRAEATPATAPQPEATPAAESPQPPGGEGQ